MAMTKPDGEQAQKQGDKRRLVPFVAGAAVLVALASTLGVGLTGLASVGSDRWIEASYAGGTSLATTERTLVHVGAAASLTETAPTLVVGDEQQWLAAPRIPTEKTVATNVGGVTIGDRVVFSVTPKGATHALARTFEIVGIEVLTAADAGTQAPANAPQVLIAREVDTSGKPMTLRLLVTEGEAATANKSL